MTTAAQPAGSSSARSSSAGLADVIDSVRGNGLVVGAYVRGSLARTEVLAIEARIEIEGTDTYLRFAEAVSRLDIPREKESLLALPGGLAQSEATHTTMDALEAAGEKLADLVPGSDQGPGQPAPAAARAGTRRTGITQSADADRANPPGTAKGIYVYGILPGDIEMTRERTGVSDPPGQIRIVRTEKLAALVSDVDLSRPLGWPADLRAHKSVLDDSAVTVPVLPVRFGAVLASEDAVTLELLAPHHEEFSYILDELDGRHEYVLKGRYNEKAILQAALSQSSEAARLRDQIRGADREATHDARSRLGQLISEIITAERERDTEVARVATAGHCVARVIREPADELDAVHIAFLLDAGQEKHLDQVTRELAETWAGKIELQVHGPQAAYDFVGAPNPPVAWPELPAP